MQGYVDEGKLAGVMTMIARRGKVAHFEKFGKMDIAADKPMEFDTIFRIYSMTKPITSVAIMMLYEEGRFQLNDPVSKFIPEFKDLKVFKNATKEGIELAYTEREMTIRDLLTHTSGLTYGWGNGPVDKMYQQAKLFDPNGTLKDAITKLARIPLVHQPGTAWEYSVSTDVLGYLVEVISGLSFDVFLEERIFKPLGMVDTGFSVPDEKVERYAALYRPDDKSGLEIVYTAPLATGQQSFFFSGGGGLVSTASDYIRFSQMLLNGGELEGTRLLGRKTVALMTMNHLPPALHPYSQKGAGFGLGFRVLTDVAETGIVGSEGAFSWGGAASTTFWIDPEEELIGLLMTQLLANPYPFQQQFKTLTYQAIVD
jgi:CubicO group peptidase (beta-lactamase class C family)